MAHKSDPQDPLPESSWLWRRVFVFSTTGVVLFFLWGAIDRLGKVALAEPAIGVAALLTLCKWIISFTGAIATYYLLAPSAEQVIKLLQTASILRSNVQISTKRVEEDETSRVEESVTAGRTPTVPRLGPTRSKRTDDGPSEPEAGDEPPWAGQKENK